MMSLTKIKSVDNETKLEIFGYSRRQEKQLSIVIPIMIQYIIMFYYWINERFTVHGKAIKLQNNGKVAMRLWEEEDEELFNTVYGNNVINFDDKSIKKYEWTFEINYCTICITFSASSCDWK